MVGKFGGNKMAENRAGEWWENWTRTCEREISGEKISYTRYWRHIHLKLRIQLKLRYIGIVQLKLRYV
jgi:hypothetical protein